MAIPYPALSFNRFKLLSIYLMRNFKVLFAVLSVRNLYHDLLIDIKLND